jgi:[protein-PII] uridylyltransferase
MIRRNCTLCEVKGALRTPTQQVHYFPMRAAVPETHEPIAQQLVQARSHLVDALFATDAPIEAWMRQYATALDNTLRALYQRAWAQASQEAPAPPKRPLAVFATGGYGRRELAPFSDIDLTFVPAQENDPFTERLVKRLFQAMMQVFYTDAKLKVGYAYRLMDDCDALDHKTRTGLLEMRPIEGDPELIEAFTARFWRSLDPTGFTLERYRERQSRWAKLGAGILRTEPNLKEGRGGLRDRHTLNWMAEARYSVASDQVPETLVAEGVLSPTEAETLEHATRTLQRYRAYLHAISGEAREQLTLTKQGELAERLGIERAALMRTVYTALADHARLTERAIERLVNAPLVLGVGLDSIHREITPAPALEREPPEWRLLCFLLAQRYQLGLSRAIETRLEESLPHTPPPDPRAVGDTLREILSRPGEVYRVLEPMARLGVLGWAFPPFAPLMTLPAGDPTHDYTVGEHTLQAIRLLDGYACGEGNALWRTILTELAAPELLYMAMLLHDAGKQDPARPHADAGADLARQWLPQLGWSDAEVDEVAFLIQHHLLMAQTARQRDLHLPETIREFTRVVDTPERLRMLYLLTCADTQAVGERIWTPAQASFLQELYRRSMRALEEGLPDETPALTAVRKRLQRALAKHPLPDELIAAHIEQMPSGYLLNTPPDQISLHLHYIERVRAGEGPVVEFHNAPEMPYTELTLCTFDDPQPGLVEQDCGRAVCLRCGGRLGAGADPRGRAARRAGHAGADRAVAPAAAQPMRRAGARLPEGAARRAGGRRPAARTRQRPRRPPAREPTADSRRRLRRLHRRRPAHRARFGGVVPRGVCAVATGLEHPQRAVRAVGGARRAEFLLHRRARTQTRARPA